MLILISPAKTLDYESPLATQEFTEPDFLHRSEKLIKQLQKLSPSDIRELMGVSENIAELNNQRFMNWHRPFDLDNARQAVLAFKGDVYTGLAAENFKKSDFNFAQKHLRILSGLYGLLRPLDLMQPYRLEMGKKFANSEGANLYEFWGEEITDAINQQLQVSKSKVLVNLASNEYYKVVKPKLIDAEIVTPAFKDLKNGNYKIISFYAKKARGLMAAYIIQNRIKSVEDLKGFDCEGYYYSPESSNAKQMVFLRDAPPTPTGSK